MIEFFVAMKRLVTTLLTLILVFPCLRAKNTAEDELLRFAGNILMYGLYFVFTFIFC